MRVPRTRERTAPIAVRRLKTGDVDACSRIVAGDPLWQRYGVTFRSARQAIRGAQGAARGGRPVARDAGELAVARQGGQIVGFIWFHTSGTFHHSGYVLWIGVAPEAQGRGVGRALMAYAEDRVFKGGPNLFLMVSDFNRGAQTFYERLGYTRVGAIPDYVVPGITEVLYRKTRGPIAARRRG